MKKLFILVLISIFLLTPSKANAKTPEDFSELDIISNKFRVENEISGDLNFSNLINEYKKTGSFGSFLKGIMNNIAGYFFREIRDNSGLMVELLFLALLCAILENIQKSFSGSNVSNIAYYVCFMAIAALIVKSFTLTIGMARETINYMMELTNALIPHLFILVASSGGINSSIVLDPIIMVSIKVTGEVIRNFILPMTSFIVLLNMADSLSESIKVSRLAGFLKEICTWVLGFVITIFVGFVTIRSKAALTLDQVALKSTKFAVDNFIPVVGKCLSDAISTIASYSLILKDAVSIAGFIFIIMACIYPLIKILIISLIYKFVGAVVEPVSDKRIVTLLNSVGSSFTMIFACILCTAIMFIIMISIISSVGKSVILGR